MINSIYTLNSKMLGQQQELNGIADNIANLNTPGFKRLVHNYQTLPTEKSGQPIAQFNQIQGSFIDTTEGAMQETGNPLDLAITGNGFFAIDVNGRTEYTKNGRFVLNADGSVVTPEGFPVLDNNGGALAIDPASRNVSIGRDGMIVTDIGTFGQVGVFQFAEGSNAVRTGGTRYISSAAEPIPADPADFGIAQGFLEGSNVNGLTETVRMTELNRAYQAAAKAANNIEELDQRAIRTLGALPQ